MEDQKNRASQQELTPCQRDCIVREIQNEASQQKAA